jgi:hypothetical protein
MPEYVDEKMEAVMRPQGHVAPAPRQPGAEIFVRRAGVGLKRKLPHPVSRPESGSAGYLYYPHRDLIGFSRLREKSGPCTGFYFCASPKSFA